MVSTQGFVFVAVRLFLAVVVGVAVVMLQRRETGTHWVFLKQVRPDVLLSGQSLQRLERSGVGGVDCTMDVVDNARWTVVVTAREDLVVVVS